MCNKEPFSLLKKITRVLIISLGLSLNIRSSYLTKYRGKVTYLTLVFDVAPLISLSDYFVKRTSSNIVTGNNFKLIHA